MSKTFNGALSVTKGEIERACSYMSDDTVAVTFGISKERVARIRRGLPRREPVTSYASGDPIGFDPSADRAVSAASEQLRTRMQAHFESQARRVGCPVEFARDCLLDGPRAALARHQNRGFADVIG